jgi:hypothetical protein
MKKKILQVALLAGLGFYAQESSAQMFRLNVTDYGNLIDQDNPDALEQAFINFVDTEIGKIETEINKELPNSSSPKRFMEGMANSSVMAGKGIGSDYASNMEVFLVGAGIGVGVDMEKDDATDSDISGLGVAPGLVVGANLGFIKGSIFGLDPKRLNLYLNFMSYSHDQDFEDDASKKSSAGIEMKTLGAHVRYDLVKGAGNKFLGWGGVKLHLGYEYNKTNLEFNTTLSETVSETSDAGETISGTISGSPTAKIAVATHSIPIEVSTDAQLFYFLSVYGGLGADLNFGQAKGDGALNADPSEIECNGGVCAGGQEVTILPEANIDATGKVNSFMMRGFAGLQFNLPFFRIYGQVDKAFGTELLGASVGARFVY